MNNSISVIENNDLKQEFIMYNDTLWMTSKQMQLILDTTKQNISKHLKTLFLDDELLKSESTLSMEEMKLITSKSTNSLLAPFLNQGNNRTIFYNLDTLIALGFKVKSQRAVNFRIWARDVIKQKMLGTDDDSKKQFLLDLKNYLQQGINNNWLSENHKSEILHRALGQQVQKLGLDDGSVFALVFSTDNNKVDFVSLRNRKNPLEIESVLLMKLLGGECL